jgi:hypothetical protein
MRLNRLRAEEGYTMIAVVGAITLVTALVGAALAATNADLGLVKRDLDDKRAYAAAQAGIADYSFHLNNDTGYWARCAGTPDDPLPGPHAVNLDGAPSLQKREVQGSTATDRTEYAIELIPASGKPACNTDDPSDTMLEQSGLNIGTFRIRSTGYAGKDGDGDGDLDVKQSIVATFKQASFLDFLYFTQLETSDPTTYGYANPSPALDGANEQCEKYRREGREDDPIPGTFNPETGRWDYCDRIVFVSADDINGPVHTNDDFAICGSPQFGRTGGDVTEVSAGPPGWIHGGCSGGANPIFKGGFVTNAPVLTPPPTNTGLKAIAGPSYTYTGQTRIDLSGNTMRINGGPSEALPPSGVIYVQNASCSVTYSPFTATYPPTSGCGNALVATTGSNSYTGKLTIAAENDIIIVDDVRRSGDGMLGLIANNFVRVYHDHPSQTSKFDCVSNSGGSGLNSPDVDAAILAIDHSFIVDHYNCGPPRGTLTVNGAIAQKFRGAVGTVGGGGGASHGYVKNYNYDDRLRYQSPPHFFDPVESAWHVQRETLDFD